MTHRVNSGRTAGAAALAAAILGMGGFLAYRLKAERDAKRPPPAPPIEVRGARIDEAPVPPPDAAAPATPASADPSKPYTPPGHDPNRHKGPGPTVRRTKEAEEEYPEVSFATLAGFIYVVPPRRTAEDRTPHQDQIPEELHKLNGKKVCVVGYMMPTELDGDRILGFYLMRNVPQCCFGVAPQTNEWIVATVDKDADPPEHHLTPCAIEGVLEVGEAEEDGWVASIYRMKVTRVIYTE